jgi:hypothetical protein
MADMLPKNNMELLPPEYDQERLCVNALEQLMVA